MYFFLDKPAPSTVKTTVNETSISQNAQVLGNVIAIFIFLFQHQYLSRRKKQMTKIPLGNFWNLFI